MPLVSEFLNGGIVTARDPSLLASGELQQAAECVYRANDPALYRAPGRTLYNTTTIKDSSGATCPVKGLVWLPFGNRYVDQMLALGGNDNGKGTLWYGDFTAVNGSATFTQITGPGQATDAVTTNNSTTLTSASGAFANMVAGARVRGTGIPLDTYVLSVTSSTSIELTNKATASATITASFDLGFLAAPSDAGTEILDAIQWGGVYFVTDGIDAPYRVFNKKRGSTTSGGVLTDIMAVRKAGLDPVIDRTVFQVSVVAGSWPSIANLGNGYYWFMLTEVFNPGQDDEVEGTYAAKDVNGKIGPVSGQISAYATQTFRITFPGQINTGANGRLSTHWRIYMSPKSDDATTIPSLAAFRCVLTTPIGAATVDLTDTSTSVNTTQAKYAGAVTTYFSRSPLIFASNMVGAPDGNYAVAQSYAGYTPEASTLTTFGFSTGAPYSSSTVTGVQVEITGYNGGGNTAGFFLYVQTTAGKNARVYGVMDKSRLQTISFGGQFDTLGVPWSYSDFADGTFQVVVAKSWTNSTQNLYVASVRVTVFYSGGSINLNGAPFRVVTYRDQVGNSLNVPAAMPPPAFSTGDIFQGSLVTNDVANEDSIRFSLPGYPEAFPDPYVLKFNERRHNTVNFIRRVGQVLVVGLSDAVKRVNYLPSEQDTNIQEGLAHEDLASDHGIVGPLAGCLFTMPGAGQMLAYVGENGLHVTDGVMTRFLNLDLKWSTLVEAAYLNKVVLRDYPTEQWLVMYYTPLGGTKNTRALIFQYSQDKIKQGGMIPAIGPVSVAGRSVTKAKLANKYYLLTGSHSGGTIYIEDSGTAIPNGYSDGAATVVGAPRVRTRQFYPSGIDRNTREERIYVHYEKTGSLVVTTNCTYTKGSATVTMASTTGLVAGMLVVTGNVAGDTIILSVDNATTITISTNANEAGTFSTGFDNSTLAVTVYRENIGEDATACETAYASMRVGSLLVVHPDNQGQALELQLDKVVLPNGTQVDAGVTMKINHFSYDMDDAGKEQNRAGS